VSSSASGSSVTIVAFGRGVDHAGRASKRSGRARHRSSSGASTTNVARYSSRSRSVRSAQWMSSTTATSGRSAASASKSLRNAQNVSSTPASARPWPSAAATYRAAVSPSSPPTTDAVAAISEPTT
jgi:hypothetical protein